MNVRRYFFRKISLLAILVSLLQPSFAQLLPDLPTDLQLGAKAGLVSSKIVGGVSTYFTPKIMLGGWAIYPSPYMDEMDFKAEILLTTQGALDATRREATGRWGYTYINVPLMVSFTPFETEKLRVDAGLQPGFLVKARYRDNNQTILIGPETRNVDMAIVLGVAYHFKDLWFVDGRIVLAVFNHSKRTWTEDNYFNQMVQFGVGRKLTSN